MDRNGPGRSLDAEELGSSPHPGLFVGLYPHLWLDSNPQALINDLLAAFRALPDTFIIDE